MYLTHLFFVPFYITALYRKDGMFPISVLPYAVFYMQDYEKFWENFGKHLKLGCIEDRENHKRIAPLLRFFSSQSEEELISLDEYVENMKPDQKDIYYIAADSVTSAKNTPFLERLAEKDLEVCLFLSEFITLYLLNNLLLLIDVSAI